MKYLHVKKSSKLKKVTTSERSECVVGFGFLCVLRVHCGEWVSSKFATQSFDQVLVAAPGDHILY
jgi:hypothetical protein